jgi:agmatinase
MPKNLNFDHTFIACDAEYDKSNIVIFGAPYDGTTSNRPGTRFAPQKIRQESYGLETYSPRINADLTDIKVADIGNLEFSFGNPKPMLKAVGECAADIANDKKIPFLLGGEHLVTLGAVCGLSKIYNNFDIIHFDAHADLRDNYLGEPLSHACVMRRCIDYIGNGKIYQFGIRSGEKSEFEYAEKNTHLTKFNLEGLDKICNSLKNKPVYITIDLDVLDTSVFGATGTPEPGGVTFRELETAIAQFNGLNVIGADIVEYSPPYDLDGSNAAVAAKVVRETLLTISKK